MRQLIRRIKTAVALFQLKQASRNKKILLIGSHTGKLTGNALGLAIAAKSSPDFLPVFITNDTDPLPEKLGIPTFGKQGRAAQWLWPRAAVAAYTCFYRYDFDMGEPTALRLQLWHGMPMKGVGVNSPPQDMIYEDCELALATSKFTAIIMEKSLRIPQHKFLLEGEPKTDPMAALVPEWNWLSNLKRKHKFIIAYVPTWREKAEAGGIKLRADHEGMAKLVERLMSDPDLLALLQKHNAAFVVRMHSLNRPNGAPVSEPFYLMNDSQGEAGHLLEASDVVIADYSSLVVDALLYKTALALWAEDFDEYSKVRTFPYYDFKETMGWAAHWSLESLRTWLSDRLENKPLPSSYHEGHKRCVELFHAKPRGGAAERILEALRQRLAEKRHTAKA